MSIIPMFASKQTNSKMLEGYIGTFLLFMSDKSVEEIYKFATDENNFFIFASILELNNPYEVFDLAIPFPAVKKNLLSKLDLVVLLINEDLNNPFFLKEHTIKEDIETRWGTKQIDVLDDTIANLETVRDAILHFTF